MLRKILLFVLALYLLLNISCHDNPTDAEQGYGIFGSVHNADGAPLVNAYIDITYFYSSVDDPSLYKRRHVGSVELSSFGAYEQANNISVYWQTTAEMNNLGFELSKNNPDRDTLFHTVAYVAGAGTTYSSTGYHILDTQVVAGHTYLYRLKIIARDSSFTYSDVVEFAYYVGIGSATYTSDDGSFGMYYPTSVLQNPKKEIITRIAVKYSSYYTVAESLVLYSNKSYRPAYRLVHE